MSGQRGDRLLVVEVSPPEQSYAEPDAVAAYFDRALAEMAAIPGARGAATVNPQPLNHELYSTHIRS